MSRKTEKGLPQYLDRDNSDTFVIAGAEDLVPLLKDSGGNWQEQYRQKIKAGWPGVRIVSEGDSWFQYPILLDDVVGQIFDRYGIFSMGEAGDLLAHMIDEDGLTKAVADEQPDVFLIIHKVQLDPAKESSCQ